VIVGIVDNVRHEGMNTPAAPAMYVPFAFFPRGSLKVYIRTAGDPAAMMESVRQAVAAFDPDLPISDLAPLPAVVSEAVSQPRFLAMLLALFAGFALLLAALGMYGVIAYGVSQRLQEIGIRIALGAVPLQVVTMVVKQALLLGFIGCVAGLLGAVALTRTMSAVLFNVSATDPFTFAVVPLALLGVALLAAVIPALRATRADPMTAFR
jgi:ABC-type antimicrobial peptide transport system permease subunit